MGASMFRRRQRRTWPPWRTTPTPKPTTLSNVAVTTTKAHSVTSSKTIRPRIPESITETTPHSTKTTSLKLSTDNTTETGVTASNPDNLLNKSNIGLAAGLSTSLVLLVVLVTIVAVVLVMKRKKKAKKASDVNTGISNMVYDEIITFARSKVNQSEITKQTGDTQLIDNKHYHPFNDLHNPTVTEETDMIDNTQYQPFKGSESAKVGGDVEMIAQFPPPKVNDETELIENQQYLAWQGNDLAQVTDDTEITDNSKYIPFNTPQATDDTEITDNSQYIPFNNTETPQATDDTEITDNDQYIPFKNTEK